MPHNSQSHDPRNDLLDLSEYIKPFRLIAVQVQDQQVAGPGADLYDTLLVL